MFLFLSLSVFALVEGEKISLMSCLSFMMHRRVSPQNNHHRCVHDGPEEVPSG